MFRKLPFYVSGLLAGALILLAVAIGVFAEDAPERPAEDKELKPLLVERRAVLQEAVRAAEQTYRAGQTRFESVIELRCELSHADLALAATSEQRIAIYQRLVEEVTAWEKATEDQYKAGQATQVDYLRSKAARLQAQIDLARAKITNGRARQK